MLRLQQQSEEIKCTSYKNVSVGNISNFQIVNLMKDLNFSFHSVVKFGSLSKNEIYKIDNYISKRIGKKCDNHEKISWNASSNLVYVGNLLVN